MRAKAEREIKAQFPGVSEDSTKKLVDARYQAISDSMQDVEIFNVGIKKYTLASAKDEELKLGLDLQGGMNVTLEVSLDEMVRSMSNNPKDPALNKAIATASQQRGNSEANFITLFCDAYLAQNQGASLSTLFLKPSEKAITRTSTNQEVIKVLNDESKDAIKRTYNVLQTRIDKFGVSSPNVNLDEKKGIITVELAGVTNPERVRQYLQATAKLQFFETYTNEEIIGALSMANDALARHLAGNDEDTTAKANDTTKTAATAANDTTGGLGTLMGKKDSKADGAAMAGKDSTSLKQAEAIAKNPLFATMNPFVDP